MPGPATLAAGRATTQGRAAQSAARPGLCTAAAQRSGPDTDSSTVLALFGPGGPSSFSSRIGRRRQRRRRRRPRRRQRRDGSSDGGGGCQSPTLKDKDNESPCQLRRCSGVYLIPGRYPHAASDSAARPASTPARGDGAGPLSLPRLPALPFPTPPPSPPQPHSPQPSPKQPQTPRMRATSPLLPRQARPLLA